MFFNIIKCKDCNCSMQADFECSLQEYLQNEFKNDENLIIASESTPIVPNYLILKCENRECSKTLKITFEEFFNELKNFWAELAFKSSQSEAKKSYTFDKYATKYLIDGVTNKALTKKDIEGNLVLKDLYELLEKENNGK